MSRSVTIHSDGTGRGTVVLGEDGQQIPNLAGLNIYITPMGVVEATLEVHSPTVVVQAHATEVQWTCPSCNVTETHKCDETFGEPLQKCDNSLIVRDPWMQHDCIRGKGHDAKHFDGNRVWE